MQCPFTNVPNQKWPVMTRAVPLLPIDRHSCYTSNTQPPCLIHSSPTFQSLPDCQSCHVETPFSQSAFPNALLILGQPWLWTHNPHMDWRENPWLELILSLSPSLPWTVSPVPVRCPHITTELFALSTIPAKYHDLCLVFSIEFALSLPPLCPHDCHWSPFRCSSSH